MPSSTNGVRNVCLVCGAFVSGIRMGMDVCRACALFFKRSIQQRKRYLCRQGHRQCEIKKDDPYMCRLCRLLKCRAVGMRMNHPELHEEPVKCEKPIKEEPCTSSPPVQSSPGTSFEEGTTIIDRMGRAYRSCREQRIENERCLRDTAEYKSKEVISATGETFYLCTYDFEEDALPGKVTACMSMAKKIWPDFAALPREHQQAMLKVSAATYHFFEMGYLAEKYFPGDDRYLLKGYTTVLDVTQIETVLAHKKEERTDGDKSIEHYAKKFIQLTRPHMRDANLTEAEFHAALCIIIWDLGHVTWIQPELVQMGDEMIENLCKELGRYYKETMKCEEYASRLGRLLSLIHTIREAGILAREQYQLFKLLGLCKDDDLILKVLN